MPARAPVLMSFEPALNRFTVAGIPCLGLNGGPAFSQSEAFSFQISTEDQEETDRYWDAIVGNGGQESACGWCKDRWGVSWQVVPFQMQDFMSLPDQEKAQQNWQILMGMGKIQLSEFVK